MSEQVTRDDINEIKSDVKDLYNKHNEATKGINRIAISVAEIAASLKHQPPVPKQPCDWFNKLEIEVKDHLKDHNERNTKSIDSVKNYSIKIAIDIIKWLAILGAGVIIGVNR
jgi:hypothetical protein